MTEYLIYAIILYEELELLTMTMKKVNRKVKVRSKKVAKKRSSFLRGIVYMFKWPFVGNVK